MAKEECEKTFKNGKMDEALLLLPKLEPGQADSVRMVFSIDEEWSHVEVSLLHLAAFRGWLVVVDQLATNHACDVNWGDNSGLTPLHYAALDGQLEVADYFITKRGCDPMCKNKYGLAPLHCACRNGHLNLARYLISKQHCDPLNQTEEGWTPLHYGCSKGHLDITQYLVQEHHCDPSCADIFGVVPLHLACKFGHTHIVRYLLSTGRIDINSEDDFGFTPIDHARESGSSYELLKLFEPLEQSKRDYPVDRYTKVILTGNSGAGKTTTARLVYLLVTNSAAGYVTNIQTLTAGIVPLQVKSNLKGVNSMVIYDFAGQEEYYSSHAAILGHSMIKSAAIFICLVDISQSLEEIRKSVNYWISFMETTCTTERMSQLIFIGSHADKLVCPAPELEEKSSLIELIAESRVKKMKYKGFISMNCCRNDINYARPFISLLSKSQREIIVSQPSISFYCHLLYAFLDKKLKKVACTLQELNCIIAARKDSCLPTDTSVLTNFLATLNDKGLILFLKNKECLLSSWVVVKKDALLSEVNGSLFAPSHFKEHRNLASNTGIVPIKSLQKVFPQYSSEMLVGFLQSMEFCKPVDSSVLQYTNLQTTHTQSSAGLLFFPSLVQLDRPASLTQSDALHFGWCLGCMDPDQFFTFRFLHVLLLCVAYTFPLVSRYNPASCPFQRKCIVWRNGISWSDNNNITTVIELIKNRSVVVAMSSNKDRPVEHAKLRSALLSLVRHLQEEHCSSLDVCEFLISPALVQQYPFNELPDTDLFDIRDVAESILLHQPSVRSYKDSRGCLPLESLSFEPYYLLSSSSVCQLLDSSMADQPVPAPLLDEVCRHCHQPQLEMQDHKELRECVDSLSIFAGMNPLELAELKEDDISHNAPGITVGPSSTLNIDNLDDVLDVVDDLTNWKKLGLGLGLRYPTLTKIEKEQRGSVEDCKMEMLSAWLQQQDNVPQKGVPSWSVLRSALQKMGANELADQVKRDHPDSAVEEKVKKRKRKQEKEGVEEEDKKKRKESEEEII